MSGFSTYRCIKPWYTSYFNWNWVIFIKQLTSVAFEHENVFLFHVGTPVVAALVYIIIGVLIVARSTTKCFTCGALVGVLYVLISYICFSALLGAFALSIENLWDVLFGMVVGGIVGIIINIIRK